MSFFAIRIVICFGIEAKVEVVLTPALGLISQVAEDLWEVKNKTVTNLTKEDITIVDYKKALAKRSECFHPSTAFHRPIHT